VTGADNRRVNPSLPLAVVLCLAFAASASAQEFKSGRHGAPCSPGDLAYGRLLLACGADGTYRVAEPDDIPPTPEGGYASRPWWFPPLGAVTVPTNPPACPLTGRVTFTSPVIAGEDLLPIIPQGMMISDHVTPIDHGYFGVRPLAKARADRTESDYVPVRAPADAEIISVSTLGSPTSIRVVMAHGCDTISIYMVLNRVSGALAHIHDELMATGNVNTSIRVLAEEEFGRQRDNPLDFSVHDGATWLPGFAGPFSYANLEQWKPYTVDPWPYFSPDLAALYTANMQRLAEPRWGRIDLDVPGTAAGNWFLDGTLGYTGLPLESVRADPNLPGGMVPGKRSYAWSHLALAPHWVQSTKWLFSTGWFVDPAGDPQQFLMDLDPGQPAPDTLIPAHGPVVYRLATFSFSVPLVNEAPLPIGYGIAGGQVMGYVAIQVLDAQRIAVEVFPNVTAPPAFAGFSAARRVYRR
jgi:hypothetical protein